MLQTVLDYGWEGRSVQVQAAGRSAVRYYAALDTIRTVSHSAAGAVSARLPARSAVRFTQTAAYTPSYLYGLFPGFETTTPVDALPPSPDYAVDGAESYAYGTGMTVIYNVLGKNSLSATVERQQSETRGGMGTLQDLDVYATESQYSRRVGRHTVASARYRYRVGDVAPGDGATSGARMVEHGVELGADYRRPLSATRQLTVEGRVGSAALLLPDGVRAVSVTRKPYRVLGDMAIGYQFKRTWRARATYRRSIEYVAGLAEPVSTDGMTARVEGWPARRIDVLASAGYSSGESTWNPSSMVFDTYTGNLKLRYVLTRVLSVYFEYLYYFYDFRGTMLLGPGIPRRLERNGGRAGFTLDVPALRR